MHEISRKLRDQFLTKYNISEKSLRNCKITINEAQKVIGCYEILKPQLENIAGYLTTELQKSDDVHSVRYRVKDIEHLIEKIIRKNKENKNRNIDCENFEEQITDLIGIRVLHIFKEEWLKIHEFIINTFELKVGEKPKVYYKKGDSDQFLLKYINKGLLTEEHSFGYRSIHYVIKTNATKKPFYAEIQVRTIYEEAWSEIDHRVRYPYNQNHLLYGQILYILNSLSHSADEVGSFINNFKNIFEDFNTQLINKEGQINDINILIDEMEIPDQIKVEFKSKLRKINSNPAKGEIKQVLDLIKNMNLSPKL